MPDHNSTSISINGKNVNDHDDAELHQALATSVLMSPTKPPPAPKKRNKLHAIFLRAMEKRANKKRGTPEEQKAASLKFAAISLHADIERATWTANDLLKRARATPRPATPPDRDPLFQRPHGAPLSAYETTVDVYNKIVGTYGEQRAKCQWLQQRVAKLNDGIGELKIDFVPAKKVGKMEHEVEGLENAGRNLVLESTKLGEILEEVRERAVA